MKIQGVTLTGGIKLNTSAAPAPGPTPGPVISNGYVSGGASINVPRFGISKFSMSTDSDATNQGDLTTLNNNRMAGQSSSEFGYNSGGDGRASVIDKFPFASEANATSVGVTGNDQSFNMSGQSSDTHGYNSGGSGGPASTISKFPFASDGNSTSVGTLAVNQAAGMAGQSSSDHGYACGGYSPNLSSWNDTIQKFPFASDSNASDIANLSLSQARGSGQSSTTSGYVSGGGAGSGNPPAAVTNIDKFPFASDNNSVTVAYLAVPRLQVSGQSGNTHGYCSGGAYGYEPHEQYTNTIQKFSFETDANATDIADLIHDCYQTAGQQG